MTRRRSEAARVQDALRLRAALLRVFAGAQPTEDELSTHRDAAADAWAIVLACECCALPLAARLRGADVLRRLPPGVQTLITQRETAELQRVLAARQLLEELDEVSAGLGIPFVVLKGGALAAEHERAPLDLGDVDVLLPAGLALNVWSALAERKWCLKSGEPMPVRPAQSDANHLPGLVSPSGGLAVELHTSLEYGTGARDLRLPPTRALKNRRSLRRLIGAYGVVTTLRHSVIKHPHRRGHLRDLALLEDTLRESGVTGDEIEGEIATDRYAEELREMLSQARALASGERPDDNEATVRFVAWKYATAVGGRGVLGPLAAAWRGISYLPLERPAVRRFALASQLRYAFAAVPPDSPFNASARRHPARGESASLFVAVAGAAARVVRTAYRTALLVLLTTLGPSIRHRIDEMISA